MGGCDEISPKTRRRSPSAVVVVNERRNTTGPSATSIDDLNDDALVEIFLNLRLDCVHRYKGVSKRWLSLNSSSVFVRCYVKCRTSLPLPHHQCFTAVLLPFCHVVVCEGDRQTSPATKHFDFNLSFLPVMQNPISRNNRSRTIEILQISNGLILCQATHPSSYQQFVCNPLTKQWIPLPPLPWGGGLFARGVGFISYRTSENYDKVSVSLVVIDGKKDAAATTIRVWMFTTQTGCWIKYDVACPAGSLSSSWSNDTLCVCVTENVLSWYAGSCIIIYIPSEYPYKCAYALVPSSVTHCAASIRRLAVSSRGKFILHGTIANGKHYNWIWNYTDNYFQQPHLITLFQTSSCSSGGFLPGDDVYNLVYSEYCKKIYLNRRASTSELLKYQTMKR